MTCVRLNALKVAVRRLRTAAAAAKEAGEGEGFSFYSDWNHFPHGKDVFSHLREVARTWTFFSREKWNSRT